MSSANNEGRFVVKPKAFDLFAGAGGLSLGLRWAGFRPVGAVELDPDSSETYRRNHPRVKLWTEDIQRVSCAEVLRGLKLKKGQLDLLAGCPPCQGFSALRTKNGRRSNRDTRNDLIDEMARFARGLRPKAVMMENVPRLGKDVRFRTLCNELRDTGYSVASRIINAEDFGVAQRRKRLVMLASRIGEVSFPDPLTDGSTVREAIGHLPSPSASQDPLHNVEENRADSVRKMIAMVPRDGGSRGDISEANQLDCHKRIQGFHDVYGRMAWDAVAPTLTSGCLNPSKGRFLHPDENRAITPREAALIQSFPEDYWFNARRGKEHLALQIGNAFPPKMIQHVAQPCSFGFG